MIGYAESNLSAAIQVDFSSYLCHDDIVIRSN